MAMFFPPSAKIVAQPIRNVGLRGAGRVAAEQAAVSPGPRHAWDFSAVSILAPDRSVPHPVRSPLRVGAADHPLERAADKVAAQARQTPAKGATGLAGGGHVAGSDIDAGAVATPEVERVLARPGTVLAPDIRAAFAPALAPQAEAARIHTDADAARSARSIGARAYTVGRDIVFGDGAFAPGTSDGMRLLGHELAHVAQQTGGGANRLVQRSPVPGQDGHRPASSRKLRVTIVGHASPRWRSAAGDAQADRRNETLANQRADAVRTEVERMLREHLGRNVPIEINVSLATGRDDPDVGVSAYGEGSREALQAGGRDRQSNMDYDRRVDVQFDMTTAHEVSGGVSLPPIQAETRHWSMSINEFRLLHPIAAVGGIELAIRNRETGKEFLATAKLYGVGRTGLNPFSMKQPLGTRRVWFDTKYPVSIQDFEGTRIEVSRIDAKLLIGETVIGVDFTSLGSTGSPVYHEFGFGGPGGFLVWGDLHLWGDTTDDVAQTDVVAATVRRRTGEGLLIGFPTGKSVMSQADHDRLEAMVGTWSRQFGTP